LIMQNTKLSPFLKWAGGKRWLVNKHEELFKVDYKKYYEPFLGSGAVFFFIEPNEAILSDINSELVITYNAIKENWELVYHFLLEHHKKHDKKYYYKQRLKRYRNKFKKAARFIYLNRTCWNALYRVNTKGLFNVPIGTKKRVVYEKDDFKEISEKLNKAKIICADFENIIDRANKNDFLFVDPPYITKNTKNGFIKYNDKIFTWEDELRLFNSLKRASKRGVKILFTNTYHRSITMLYKNDFIITKVARSSILASDPKHRKITYEIVIRSNYDVQR